MFVVYMLNHYTGTVIFIQEFQSEHDAHVFIIEKNQDPKFEYFVRKKNEKNIP